MTKYFLEITFLPGDNLDNKCMENNLAIPIYKVNEFSNRYTRFELKNAGYSLAFFDNSALNQLKFVAVDGQENRDLHLQQKFIDTCKSKKVRPVLSIEVIGELVKGLDARDSRFEDLRNKKITILRVLQESGLLWSLPFTGILDLERWNIESLASNTAHEFLYLFSEYPLCQIEKNKLRKSCLCDRDYTFGPDKPTVINNGDIGKWFASEIAKDSKLKIIKDNFDEFKHSIHSLDENISQQLLPDKACINFSPFIKIWNSLVSKEHKKYLSNERLDTLHGTFGLSYCVV